MNDSLTEPPKNERNSLTGKPPVFQCHFFVYFTSKLKSTRKKQYLLKAELEKVVINVLLPIQPKFQITEGNSLSHISQ